MALRGTLTHRKTRRLALAMGISPCYALGVLESLWHVTGEQAPNGAIGRMTDQDIAMEMFYDGEPSKLISDLMVAGLVDASDDHRLIVHDWHIHSDDATDNKLARSVQRYANGKLPRMRRLSKKERELACAHFNASCDVVRTEAHGAPLPVPVPEPVPEPEPEPEPETGRLTPAPETEGFPAGLPNVSYASGILEHRCIPDTFKLRELVGKTIASLAKLESLDTHKAAEALEDRISAAQENGESITSFWFSDSKWRKDSGGENGTNKRGAAVGRVERTLSAWDRAAVGRQGVQPVEPPMQADASVLPPSGIPGRDGPRIPIRPGEVISPVRA